MGTKALDPVTSFTETFKALGLGDSDEGRIASQTPQVLSVLASLFERSIGKNEKQLQASRKEQVVSIFHGSKPATLSIREYIERIFKYSNCSTSCFIVAYIYIERFLQKRKGFCLTSLNVHRLLITSVMVAAKFLDDTCENNAYYAQIGGVSTTAEMNDLEMEFLFSLDFRLQVTAEVFANYCRFLEREGDGGYQTGCRTVTRSQNEGQQRTIKIKKAPEYDTNSCRYI
ncbi:hypothetical protein UlMin_029258 [Ulmus minor]